MKSTIILILLSSMLLAQNYTVTKIKGGVKVLKGMNEQWQDVKVGDQLTPDDLIMTDKASSVILKKEDNSFLLEDESAIELNYVKKTSKHELLLALTMEEINSINNNSNKQMHNTAVYGKNETGTPLPDNILNLGVKKLNGALQLAANGFTNSAILAAKQTLAKHPSARKEYAKRLKIVDLMTEAGLYEEAANELTLISNQSNTGKISEDISKRFKFIKTKMQELNK